MSNQRFLWSDLSSSKAQISCSSSISFLYSKTLQLIYCNRLLAWTFSLFRASLWFPSLDYPSFLWYLVLAAPKEIVQIFFLSIKLLTLICLYTICSYESAKYLFHPMWTTLQALFSKNQKTWSLNWDLNWRLIWS